MIEFKAKGSQIVEALAEAEAVKVKLAGMLENYDEDSEVFEHLENALEAMDDAIDELHDALDI